MLTAPQLEPFFPDLSDPRYRSALALVHSRFSTNTFPSWPLAHPYRYVAHNGEINTVRGNRNWMRAREAMLATDLIPDRRRRPWHRAAVPGPGRAGSDSASFDACLELLHLGGRSLPHAVLMMIPEPWENNDEMDPARRAFYQFHATLMEPWDGPALIAFTDGTLIGAVLDRNGLRPGRYWVTRDGLVVLASEVGVLDIDPATVIRKGRLQPGRIFLVDTAPAASSRTKRSRRPGRGAPVRGLAARRADAPGRPARPRDAAMPGPAGAGHASSSCSATPKRSCGSSSPRWPGPAPSRSGPWAPTPRSRCCPTRPAAGLRLLHPDVRPGDEPAAGRHPGGAGHLAGRPPPAPSKPVRPLPGVLPPDRAAVPGDQRRATWPRSCTSTPTATCPGSRPM